MKPLSLPNFTMTTYILKIAALFFMILSVLLGFYLQGRIRKLFPSYDPVLFVAGFVFIIGCGYALMARNFIVILFVLMVTLAIPLMGRWIPMYWPY
jgi:hypothetical protein